MTTKTTTRIALAAIALFAVAVAPVAADPGRGAQTQCYFWANDPTSTSTYSPSSIYSYNAVARAQGNLVTRVATGVYNVTCKGVGGGALFKEPGTEESTSVSTEQVAKSGEDAVAPATASGSWGFGGHVQVTAYGSDDVFCKIQGWATGGADLNATVRCFKSTGVAADSRFDFSFIW